ncbi:hypothetical protein AK830_g6452 [Neonectria ditissima]|uniref:Uncharacterized protein n=1 Tax=Neonectria ditissima TaxID=78410 RepID=A0A0P7AQJ5_9HYPO|nr:hypothetical protein AK830_g6452 [Neonectria ditissima]
MSTAYQLRPCNRDSVVVHLKFLEDFGSFEHGFFSYTDVYATLLDLRIVGTDSYDEKRIEVHLNYFMELCVQELKPGVSEEDYWMSVARRFLGYRDVGKHRKSVVLNLATAIMVARVSDMIRKDKQHPGNTFEDGALASDPSTLLACNATIFLLEAVRFPHLFPGGQHFIQASRALTEDDAKEWLKSLREQKQKLLDLERSDVDGALGFPYVLNMLMQAFQRRRMGIKG